MHVFLGHSMDTDHMKILVSDYYATGEGRTVCILVTKAYPREDDYLVRPHFDKEGFHKGELANTADVRAAREFLEEFGSFYTMFAERVEKEKFLETWLNFIPPALKKLLDSDAGNVYYTAKLHFNFG